MSPHNNPFILDLGAPNHVTSSFTWFQTYSKIKAISVNFPNSSSITSYYSGVVRSSSSFVIHNILYVPKFNFNLVSISKLVSSLHCTLNFSDDFCKIWDVTSLKMFGLTKLREGFYNVIVRVCTGRVGSGSEEKKYLNQSIKLGLGWVRFWNFYHSTRTNPTQKLSSRVRLGGRVILF